MTECTAYRIVPCEHCGTEGRIYSGQYEDERDCGPCPVCEGTGGEIIKTEPAALEPKPTIAPCDDAEFGMKP
jgi:hypothetical protein